VLQGAQTIEFELENWRRRPDLNRGWRFCRPYRVVNRDAWLRLLVPDVACFCVVFGRYCSEVAPKILQPRKFFLLQFQNGRLVLFVEPNDLLMT
jgi:hypothetical protein